METGSHGLGAVALEPIPAQLAVHAHVPGGLDTGTVADLPVLHLAANPNDDTGALVARRLDAVVAHPRQWQILQHIVDVAVADSRSVQLDEDFLRAFGWVSAHVNISLRLASSDCVWKSNTEGVSFGGRAGMQKLTGYWDRDILDLNHVVWAIIEHHAGLTCFGQGRQLVHHSLLLELKDSGFHCVVETFQKKTRQIHSRRSGPGVKIYK